MPTLFSLIRTLLFGWIASLIKLWRALRELCRAVHERPREPKPGVTCFPIDHPAFMRPDPLLYSQQFLMAKELAVTWDNPDITLSKGGVPVSSSELETSTTYDVNVRVWNNSLEAPVVHMPVRLSYLDFGIGTVPIAVGSAMVDVGVKGSASQPAFVSIPWTTPSTPGHYCLQVLLDPADDLDPTNNLGQENTDVAKAASPANFTFTLRNNTRRTRRYRFEADAYVIPAVPDCSTVTDRRKDTLERHRRDAHPVPLGFVIQIVPDTPTIAPDAAVVVQVSVTPPVAFVGRQPINVNAFHDGGFAGGVTLVTTKGV